MCENGLRHTVWWASFMADWIRVILIIWAMAVWFFNGVILANWTADRSMWFVGICCTIWIKAGAIVGATNWFALLDFVIPNLEYGTQFNLSTKVATASFIQIPWSAVPMDIV